jgi:hypothetical protein
LTYEKCYKHFFSLNETEEGYHLKPNILGLIGGVLAFICLVLPWWSLTITGGSSPGSLSIYPYQATVSSMGVSYAANVNLWYAWTALVLLILGGMLGIAGSLFAKGRGLIIIGGLLALSSIVIFVVGLQNELSQPSVSGLRAYALGTSLFSSGSYDGVSYVTYLSYGFWIALVSAILLFVASARKTAQVPPTVPMQTSPSPPQPS